MVVAAAVRVRLGGDARKQDGGIFKQGDDRIRFVFYRVISRD